jgi:hypothetical protein
VIALISVHEEQTRRTPVELAVCVAIVAMVGIMLSPAVNQSGATSGALSNGNSGSTFSPVTPPSATSTVGPPAASPPVSSAAAGVGSIPTYSPPTAPTPGPHPAAWGPSGEPPGALAAYESITGLDGGHPRPSATSCDGIWPYDGQGGYTNWSCYGHDEPGIEFYSPEPGSGGNVTWNVTLPIDRSATQNQSSLYVAIWFGMTLSAPGAWMNQCFLELQFYPDETYYNGGGTSNPQVTVNGMWIAYAVAWQIDLSNDGEDSCFSEPMYLNGQPGPSYLNMSEGDNVQVTMTGWAGDPLGENLSILDQTNHQSSYVDMYDTAEHAPLDPAYTTNSFESSLQWTPGGEYPVAFAFEIGHCTYNPDCGNNANQYGGCSPGNSSNYNLGTPCPSYDPGSWVNDTLAPWTIHTPVFFNATHVDHPAQVAFTQPEGGSAFIANTPTSIDGGTCTNELGSAWCTYPWYSYSCTAGGFHFGATDYSDTSTDFGKYTQFGHAVGYNAVGLSYYLPTNFSIPTCGGVSYSVSVGTSGPGAGTVYFLSHPTASSTYPDLGPGNYSIQALASGTGAFQHWTTSGSLRVADVGDPHTHLDVGGGGSVSAVYAATAPPKVSVTFASEPAGLGATAVVPWADDPSWPDNAGAIATIASGSSQSLVPGLYTVQAYPPVNYVFEGWTSTSGAEIAAETLPASYFNLGSLASSVTLTAEYSTSTATSYVGVEVVGLNGPTSASPGTISFDGIMGSSSTYTWGTLPVGTASITATPAAGWVFAGYGVGSGAVLIDGRAQSNLTVEPDPSAGVPIQAFFEFVATTPVTFGMAGSSAGTLWVDGSEVSSGSTLDLSQDVNHDVSVSTPNGYRLVGWTSSDSAEASLTSPGSANAHLSISVISSPPSVTVTATVTTQSATTVSFSAIGNGSFVFNGDETVAGSTSNTTVGGGDANYSLNAAPSLGYSFEGWTLAGSDGVACATCTVTVLNVTGTASVTATFLVNRYFLTFASDDPSLTATLGGSTTLTSGSPYLVDNGSYTVTTSASGFVGWSTDGGISVVSPTAAFTTVLVSGAGGTLYLVSPVASPLPFGVSVPTATPNTVRAGQPTSLSVSVSGTTGSVEYLWQNLPPGCASSDAATLPCTPEAGGTFDVAVQVSDSSGFSLESPDVVLNVIGPLAASVTASPSVIDVNETTTLAATLSGGVPPSTVTWSGLPTGCTSANTTQLSCTPSVAGTFQVSVSVRDSTGDSATGGPATLTVEPAVAARISASPAALDLGQNLTISVAPQGGVPGYGYAYADLPTGCVGANASSLRCTATDAGTFATAVTVTDSIGGAATATTSIVVNPILSVSGLSVSPTATDVGVAVQIAATTSGGTGPLYYGFSGLPAGCATVDHPDLNCTPAVSGKFTILVSVLDVNGEVATRSGLLVVASAPQVESFTAQPTSVSVVSSFALGVTVTGGTGGYSYAYSNLPIGCNSANASTVTCSPSDAGNFRVTVTVTDSVGGQTSATTTVTVTSATSSSSSGPTGPSLEEIVAILVVVVIVGAVAAVWLVRRRRGGSTPNGSSNTASSGGQSTDNRSQ